MGWTMYELQSNLMQYVFVKFVVELSLSLLSLEVTGVFCKVFIE